MKLKDLLPGSPFVWSGRTFYRGVSDTQTISVYEVKDRHLVLNFNMRLPENTIVKPL